MLSIGTAAFTYKHLKGRFRLLSVWVTLLLTHHQGRPYTRCVFWPKAPDLMWARRVLGVQGPKYIQKALLPIYIISCSWTFFCNVCQNAMFVRRFWGFVYTFLLLPLMALNIPVLNLCHTFHPNPMDPSMSLFMIYRSIDQLPFSISAL